MRKHTDPIQKICNKDCRDHQNTINVKILNSCLPLASSWIKISADEALSEPISMPQENVPTHLSLSTGNIGVTKATVPLG